MTAAKKTIIVRCHRCKGTGKCSLDGIDSQLNPAPCSLCDGSGRVFKIKPRKRPG